MQLKMYQVDAFTDKLFSGNPAAVVILESAIKDSQMQSIALENNLSETAFINISENPISIRWFTPSDEVDLCGHATLASATVLFQYFPAIAGTEIIFTSKSGILKASKDGDYFCLDFLVNDPENIAIDVCFSEALGDKPIEMLKGRDDYLAIFENQSQIQNMQPNFQQLAKLKARGLVISAPGTQVDFVSRCFYPQTGVDEDPVTGSAHTMLIPYWAKHLDKIEFQAHQLSARGGALNCKLKNDRVLIAGKSVVYFEGMISII
jgi:PhzF family phenazine biosynthesis protein